MPGHGASVGEEATAEDAEEALAGVGVEVSVGVGRRILSNTHTSIQCQYNMLIRLQHPRNLQNLKLER